MPPPAVTPFASRWTRVYGVVTALSLLAALALLLSPGSDPSTPTCGADGYSRSALGHLGWLQWLRANGEVVVQARVVRGLGPCGLLVVAEPRAIDATDDLRFRAHVAQAPATLIVLPKRIGEPDPEQPAWVESVDLLEPRDVDDVGEHVGTWTEPGLPGIVRQPRATAWDLPDGWPMPTLRDPVQLLRTHPDLEPIIACEHGVLLGTWDGVHVLADPDLIANHGLHGGDNPALVLAMVAALKGDGAVVFDETLHGHGLSPSIWHAAGRFPFVLVTVHLLLLLAVMAWIASGRFGPLQPAAAAIGAGKAFLLDNIAALLRVAGPPGPSLRRYGRQRLRSVAEALQAPRGLDDAAVRSFVLARMPAADGARLTTLLTRDAAAMRPAEAVTTARAIRHLTEDLMHARIRNR
jgi:hypothetical protein